MKFDDISTFNPFTSRYPYIRILKQKRYKSIYFNSQAIKDIVKNNRYILTSYSKKKNAIIFSFHSKKVENSILMKSSLLPIANFIKQYDISEDGLFKRYHLKQVKVKSEDCWAVYLNENQE